MSNREIHLSSTITLKVPPKELWEFLADTDRLNKSIGLPSIFFVLFSDPERKGFYTAKAKYMGFTFTYEEQPFDWIKEQFYEVVRKFRIGLIDTVTGGIRMKPSGAGTELEVYADVRIGNFLGGIAAKTILKKQAIADLVKITELFERKFLEDGNIVAQPVGIIYDINRAQFQSRFAKLGELGLPASLTHKLAGHLLNRSDLEVISMRPFDLADEWGEERIPVLKLCLYAVQAGILDLHWTVLCPNCNGISKDALTLSELKNESHCDTCMIRYNSDLVNSVEVRFSVNSSIRTARRDIYCIGGPANMPQIIAQLRLSPGTLRREKLFLQNGSIKFRSFQIAGNQTVSVVETWEPSFKELTIRCTPEAIQINTAQVKSGWIDATIENATSKEILLIAETLTWKERAATAAMVVTLQDFKDLFPQEAIAPGEEISISSIAVLFTDLKGSTTLYKNIGDIPAFNFVQSHFRYLTEYISKHYGGVYKTMGDAVMASFAKSGDAVQAAIEMQQEWNRFINEYGNHSSVKLKIGIHEGAAIAINNKGRLDCFGSTINIAAHTQRLSTGGDIVLSKKVFHDPQVKKMLDKAGSEMKLETFKAQLKGYPEEDFEFWRLIPLQ